jgi:hypothetical protein
MGRGGIVWDEVGWNRSGQRHVDRKPRASSTTTITGNRVREYRRVSLLRIYAYMTESLNDLSKFRQERYKSLILGLIADSGLTVSVRYPKSHISISTSSRWLASASGQCNFVGSLFLFEIVCSTSIPAGAHPRVARVRRLRARR